jgi:hypothetical protein
MATYTSTAFTPDRLVAGNAHLLVSRSVTILSGETRSRGDVLGKITASGKYILSLSGASDGSETPDLILAEDCDASGGDAVGVAYSRGDFDENAVTLGTAHTADSVREGLRAKGIVLVPSVSA